MKKKLLPGQLRRTALAMAVLTSAFLSPAAMAAAPDLDGDGIPNLVDPDIDNDGIPNALDRNVDGGIAKAGPFAGKYIGDHLNNDSPAEDDIDGDDLNDDSLGERDIDGDSRRNDDAQERDIDGDKRDDDAPGEMDIDGDGRDDDSSREDDIDGDGFTDDDDSEMDIDGDNSSDDDDDDIDGDNRKNADTAEDDTDGDSKSDASLAEMNDDGDSKGNRDDADDDNDGDSDEDDADHRQEDDEMEVEVSLTRLAAAPSGSRARAKIQKMASGKIEFGMDARDLPAGSYSVLVDGVSIGNLVLAQDGGRVQGEQEWETNPNKSDELPLTFDIMGKPLTLVANGVTYFTGAVPLPPVFTGGGTPPGTPVPGALSKGPAAPAGAHGKVEIEFSLTGAKELEIEIEDVPAGSYELLIGDTARGSITVSAGNGKVVFDISPETSEGELLLNFAASGEAVTIRQGEAVFFTGTVPAAPAGVGDGVVGNDDNGGGTPVVAALTKSSAAPAGSKAEVQIQFGAAGATGLEIEIEDAAPGAYDLIIDGTPRGFVEVTSSANGVKGKLRFETVPDNASELPLDFAAAGKTLTLSQGTTVFFSGTIPVAPAL